MAKAELNKEHGTPNNIMPPEVQKENREQELLDMVSSLQVQLADTNRKLMQVSQAVDPNKLAAARLKGEMDTGHFFVGIPSLDGVDPIVWWTGSGQVYQDSYKNEVDTQKVSYLTHAGKTGEMPFDVFYRQMNQNAIRAITNNLRSYRDELGYRKHERKDPDDLISVTLSDDNGESYASTTLDIKYRLLNIGPRGPKPKDEGAV